MRVLHVAATPFFSDRGCHVRIYEEVKRLARLGVEQVICTYHIGRDMPGLDIRRCIRVPWYKRTDARPSIHKVYIDFLVLVRAIRVARRFRPQVIHGHTHE
ncbi:glycosyltransferase family 1 protein, partial [Candidatus Sumerlaeota bacterium]|nr:glycosyltransferase family 1 protein [Candidatus Sumerlaeota bacterium]